MFRSLNAPMTSLTSATVGGKTVKVGDVVSFKSDVEQSGRITAIRAGGLYGHVELVLEGRFRGGYIGGQTETTELASDCWTE